ncbi:MAG: hypothetical protein RML35_01935 [Chloroherpetonaceae bacterium]|nr:hypothetical protein [Chloroherpetonaceae bacterium]MCS7210682.1 hypothetical protein [Chloroherpetonaceae bacterium]MDW8464969.1 hypothetical protein [Chloroherpetonaceae bacterium]
MKRGLFLLTAALLLSSSPSSTPHRHCDTPSATSTLAADSTYRTEYFYFQTTGTPKSLLSEATYKAVIAAAQAAGYSEDEIEVTIFVVDRKSRQERLRSLQPHPRSRQELRRPTVKKFE